MLSISARITALFRLVVTSARSTVIGRLDELFSTRKPCRYPTFSAHRQTSFPKGRRWRDNRGIDARLLVPLLREGEAIGAIALRRKEPIAFSDKQIDLLQTFADQAVIAISNVRLFDEVQAKTHDLEEALDTRPAARAS